MSYAEYSSSEKFKASLEQLIIARDLLLTSPRKSMMAMVILDQLSDNLLLGYLLRLLNNKDKSLAKFNISRRSDLYKLGYDKKVEIVHKHGYKLNSDDAVILNVCHYYRNRIYHRDSYNPTTIQVLAKLHFRKVAKLFRITQPIASKTAIDLDDFNLDFTINNPYNWRDVAHKAIVSIKKGTSYQTKNIREILILDLVSRMQAIDSLVDEKSGNHIFNKSTLKKRDLEGIRDKIESKIRGHKRSDILKEYYGIDNSLVTIENSIFGGLYNLQDLRSVHIGKPRE